jgi:hypothetical protein
MKYEDTLADLLYEAEALAACHGNFDLRDRLRRYRELFHNDDSTVQNRKQDHQSKHGAPPVQMIRRHRKETA